MKEITIVVYVTPDHETRYSVQVGGFEVCNTAMIDIALNFIRAMRPVPCPAK